MKLVNGNPLIGQLIAELEKSIQLATTLPADIYHGTKKDKGSIGAHIRHNLDFVNGLLRGVRIGSIDYATRERDQRAEVDQRYAAARIRSTIAELEKCFGIDPASLLIVRSEVRPDVRHRSSFSRELEFVYSHTVHHHALIDERLARHGIAASMDLGVAPSTQAYWDRLKIAA